MSRFHWASLCLLFVFIASTFAAGCERLTYESCTKFGYNTTKLPNLLGHNTTDAAWENFYRFSPLIQLKCSPQLEPFLCGLYFPQCHETEVVSPCRSLCLQAKDGCEPILQQYGIGWPDFVRCEQFPEEGNCFNPELSNTTDVEEAKSDELETEKEAPANVSGTNDEESSAGHKWNDTGSEKTKLRNSKSAKKKFMKRKVSAPRRVRPHSRRRQGPHVRACTPFESGLCPKLPYKLAGFPNMMGQKTARKADAQVRALLALSKTACSHRLQDLLCGLYFPECNAELQVVPPCRSLCNEVYSSCVGTMAQIGLAWPKRLHCRRLPDDDCFGKGDQAIVVLPSSIVNMTGKGSRVPPEVQDQSASSSEISPFVMDMVSKSFLSPFMDWLLSSTELNKDQAKLAVEQTKETKLREQKLNLEIDHLKKEHGNQTVS
ncbi:frizzled-8 [Elysia marginata]|uniref:Frizzled-8 n=1 Tax=Elysia marginata TaxID=1093978 RepID=A0AAV4H964_9GAST|nr:frizzled-8 [Elysia marginata]